MSAEVFVSDAAWLPESSSKRPARNLRPWQGTLGIPTVPQPMIALVQRTRGSARHWHQFGIVAVFVLLLTGCRTVEKYSLTYRVWDNEDWRKFSEPAPSPNLALFEAANHADVLVQHDAFSEKHSKIERHAYYLRPNQPRTDAGTKPELVKPSVAHGMKPIPVLPTQGALTNQPPELPAYAVVTKEGRGFTLYRPMEPVSAFDLPVYVETSGTPTRIALTPFAVAGDTVMVGVVAAVVGFLLWAQIGAPTCY